SSDSPPPNRCLAMRGWCAGCMSRLGTRTAAGLVAAVAPLRWVLGDAAHTAFAARRYFDRLRRRKHPHVARVALARKLLAAIFAMLRPCCATGNVSTKRSLRRCKGTVVSSMSFSSRRGPCSDGAAAVQTNLMCLEHE